MKRHIDYQQSDLPPRERKFYTETARMVSDGYADCLARGFFKDQTPKARFGRYSKRNGNK